MKTFVGLEGARGWLAWTVVAWHLTQLTGTDTFVYKSRIIGLMAAWSVEVFIIMSGFVITHLIISKREPYGLYIVRRALRLYPAYLVALAAGALTYPLWFEAVEAMSWLPQTRSDLAHVLSFEYAQNFWPHLAAHLTMIHGAIPNEALTQSQFMFLGPAWSASLEWQFYLVAPAVIWLLARKWGVAALLSVAILGLIAADRGLLGTFMLPSILFAAAQFFAVGICTRLAWSHLPKLRSFPVAVVAASSLLLFFSSAMFPLVVWIVLVSYMLVDDAHAKSGLIESTLRLALDSKIAKSAGARSYAVYILHVPIITVGVYLSRVVWGLSYLQTTAVTALFATAGVLLASEIVHRFVEIPAINLGRRIGRVSVPALATNTAGPTGVSLSTT